MLLRKLPRWLPRSPIVHVLFLLAVLVSNAAHTMFFTWPLTARCLPGVVELLRVPSAYVLLLNNLIFSIPMIGLSLYLRLRWWRDGSLTARQKEPRNQRPLRKALDTLLFRSLAIFLLLRFTTRDVAASLPLQAIIVAATLTFLLWDLKSEMRWRREKNKKAQR